MSTSSQSIRSAFFLAGLLALFALAGPRPTQAATSPAGGWPEFVFPLAPGLNVYWLPRDRTFAYYQGGYYFRWQGGRWIHAAYYAGPWKPLPAGFVLPRALDYGPPPRPSTGRVMPTSSGGAKKPALGGACIIHTGGLPIVPISVSTGSGENGHPHPGGGVAGFGFMRVERDFVPTSSRPIPTSTRTSRARRSGRTTSRIVTTGANGAGMNGPTRGAHRDALETQVAISLHGVRIPLPGRRRSGRRRCSRAEDTAIHGINRVTDGVRGFNRSGPGTFRERISRSAPGSATLYLHPGTPSPTATHDARAMERIGVSCACEPHACKRSKRFQFSRFQQIQNRRIRPQSSKLALVIFH